MQKLDLFIVWNKTRSEAIITDDEDDAMLAAGLIAPYNGCSSICARFDEYYGDERRTVKKFTLSERYRNETASGD